MSNTTQTQVLVPMALRRKCAAAFFLATRAPTQKAADKVIRRFLPTWDGHRLFEEATRRTGDESAQMAGTYSLDLCAGGGASHRADSDTRTRGTLDYGERVALRATVYVDVDSRTVALSEPMRASKAKIAKLKAKPARVDRLPEIRVNESLLGIK